MSRIRGSGNSETELRWIARAQFSRLSPADSGRPADFHLLENKIPGGLALPRDAVWMALIATRFHGCPRHATMPKTNRAFWTEKLSRNKDRDRKVSRTLRADGWCVLRVWECALTRRRSPATVRRIARVVAACQEAIRRA